MPQTKIIATIGPASADVSVLELLLEEGVDIFRLNLSHGSHDWHENVIKKIKTLQKTHCCGILLDTKGPEVRVGTIEPQKLEKNDEITLKFDEYNAEQHIFPVSYMHIADDAKNGDEILIEGGEVVLKVSKSDENGVRCVVTRGGMMTSKRHVTIKMKTWSLPSITKHDWEDIAWGLTQDVDFFALSFVRSGKDVQEIRDFAAKKGQRPKIIAKVETKTAVDNIEGIIDASDSIMVARGDLGSETPLAQLPHLQEKLVTLCHTAGKPVIIATQMLESMITSPVPTRAEVTDVYHAVQERADAVMLSGETATGAHPARVVAQMQEICLAAEQDKPICGFFKGKVTKIRDEMARVAVQIASDLPEITAILVLTRTGAMAQKVSRFRPCVPVLAATPSPQTCHQNALLYGVSSFLCTFCADDPECSVQTALRLIKKQKKLPKNSKIVVISDSLVGLDHKTRIPMVQVREIT